MKYLAILLALSFSAHAQDAHEYNYKVTKDNWTATARHREGTWHTELGYSFDKIDVMYRYARLGTKNEHRIKFTQGLAKWNGFSLSHRMEYRQFDVKENYWRYRFILGYKYDITPNAQFWVKIQPRWSLKDERTKFDARDQMGVKFKFGNLSISPFAERGATDDYKFDHNVYGIHTEYKL